MEANLTSSIKSFFNILRKDKAQIVNDDALTEIINLFVFYMLDSNVKQEKRDDDSINSVYELQINKNDFDMNKFNDKLNLLIDNIENKDEIKDHIKNTAWDLDDIEPFIQLMQFEKFKKLYEFKDKLDMLDDNAENVLKSECAKVNIKYDDNFYYWDILSIYRILIKMFNCHNNFKYVIQNNEHHFELKSTFDELITNLDKFKIHKQNKDYDFFGALYESLYDNYFYGSTINKNNKKLKNSMGQFFTPRNITDLLIMLVNPGLIITTDKKTNKKEIHMKTLAELSMGTGGIIKSYMKWYKELIKNKIETSNDKEKYEYIKNHFNQEVISHIFGCEKSPHVYGLCMANILMKTGYLINSLCLGDTIFNEKVNNITNNNKTLFDKQYDYICINPPFSIPLNLDKMKIFNLEDFPILPGGKNSEWLFILMTISKLKINGKAAIVIPENSHLYETSGNYNKIRELICKTCEIHKIIRCKRDTFTSTSAATIILFFTKKKDFNDVLSYNLKKGYTFDEAEVNHNNLKLLEQYTSIKDYTFDNDAELITNELNFYNFDDFNVNNNSLINMINKTYDINSVKETLKVNVNDNYSFMYDDYVKKENLEIQADNIEYKPIMELMDYGKKSARKASDGKDFGKYNFYGSSDVIIKRCDTADYKEEYIILGTGGQANVKIDCNFSCSSDNILIKSKDNRLINFYVYYYLVFNKQTLQDKFKGAMIKHLTKDRLEEILIPVISAEKQNEIILFVENEIISRFDINKINKMFNNMNVFNYLLNREFETFKEIYEIENNMIEKYNINRINKIFDNTIAFNYLINNDLETFKEIYKTENKIIGKLKNKKISSLIKPVLYKYTNECKDIKKINEICTIKSGGSMRGKENFSKGDYLVIGGGTKPCGVYTEWNTPENTVIIAGVGTSGYASIYPTKTYLTYSYSLNINDKKQVYYKYLYYYMKSKFNELHNMSNGSMMPSINSKHIGSVSIPIISYDKQKELSDYLDKQTEKINKKSDKLDLYLNYLKSFGINMINEN